MTTLSISRIEYPSTRLELPTKTTSRSGSLVTVHRIPISHKIFVQPIHRLNVRRINLKASHITVLDDARSSDTFRQWHEAVLQAPPDHELCRRARVLVRQRTNGGMLHSKGSCKWRIGLDNDVVLLAERSDLGSGVERVDFDLVDSR